MLENKGEEPQEERDGRDSLLGTTDYSVDQQHRTPFCTLKHECSRFLPAIDLDRRCLVDASSGVLWGGDWALAVRGGRGRGTRSNSSNRVWGEGLEKVDTLQKKRDGGDSLICTTDSRVYTSNAARPSVR